MIPTVKQNDSWAQPVGASPKTNGSGFLGRNQSARFSMDDLTAALYKEDERENKSDQILPFPLEQTEQFTSIIVTNIIELKNNLLTAYRSGLLKKSEKILIKKQLKKLKIAKKCIRSLLFDIEKMRL